MLDGDAPNSQQSFSWCFCPSFRSWLLPKPSAQRMSVLVRVAGCTMASDASRIAATVSIEQPGRCWGAMCSMAAIVVMAAVLARSNAKALGRARRLVLGSTGMNSTPFGLCTCGYLLANMHLHDPSHPNARPRCPPSRCLLPRDENGTLHPHLASSPANLLYHGFLTQKRQQRDGATRIHARPNNAETPPDPSQTSPYCTRLISNHHAP